MSEWKVVPQPQFGFEVAGVRFTLKRLSDSEGLRRLGTQLALNRGRGIGGHEGC